MISSLVLTKNFSKDIANRLLQSADITIDGHEPWDIQVKRNEFYQRVLKDGVLGLGESYMDEWWDCPRLDIFFERLMRAKLYNQIKPSLKMRVRNFLAQFINQQNKTKAREVGKKHYDLGNDLFTRMLDPTMNYSCGYWQNAQTLDEAQQHKMKLICEKLQLSSGMRVLDIGCGWGSLAKYAAEHYGVSVVGVTISNEQYQYAKKNCADLPIEIRLQDYRDLSESFDRVVSVGMFEHVGYFNYRTYMQTVHKVLHEDGLFLLHTIGSNSSTLSANEWISTYIFPRGMVPSVQQIAETSEGLLIMEDWHNFGADYDKTLMAWYDNFNKNWSQLQGQYDQRFYRMWNFYLLSCAGCFRARDMQLWQIVFSKNGVLSGYKSVR